MFEGNEFVERGDLENYEIMNLCLINEPSWRVRRHLWECIFAVRFFVRLYEENEGIEGDDQGEIVEDQDFRDVLVILQTRSIQLKNILEENDIFIYYPFYMLICHFITLFITFHKNFNRKFPLKDKKKVCSLYFVLSYQHM